MEPMRGTRQLTHKYKLKEITSCIKKKPCKLCKQFILCEKTYGKLYQLNDIVVHHFCILLSTEAVQNGADYEGVLGFLYEDIQNEIKRGSKITCSYCNKKGATISCSRKNCQTVFHLPCGLKNGTMHKYYDSFKSFCAQHRIRQTINTTALQNTDAVECSICSNSVTPSPIPASIWAPCCKKAWFHRTCIKEMAFYTGYFFKCPLCNNFKIFKKKMLQLGIYIPSRDTIWETVPNAYSELLERHNTCDVTPCLCFEEDQRKFQQESGPWQILLCDTCGSTGTHRVCSYIEFDEDKWSCAECEAISNKKEESKESLNNTEPVNEENTSSQPTTNSENDNNVPLAVPARRSLLQTIGQTCSIL